MTRDMLGQNAFWTLRDACCTKLNCI